MVNQVLADYLRKYNGKYPIESLKRQILSKGYSEKDFNEAIESLVPNPPSISSPLDSIPSRPKGFKLMLVGGILGLVMLLLYSLAIVLGFLGINVGLGGNLYFALAIAFIFLVLVFLYLFSFVRLSEYTESGLLKFAAVSKIIVLILSILIIAALWVYLYFALSTMQSFLGSTGGLGGEDFSVMTGNEVIDLGQYPSEGSGLDVSIFSFFDTTSWVIFLSILIFLLFILVVRFCFSIALIKIRTKFSVLAGVADLITALISTFSLFFILYAFARPYQTFLFSSQNQIAIQIFGGFLLGLSLLALLFESMCLISASRKFE